MISGFLIGPTYSYYLLDHLVVLRKTPTTIILSILHYISKGEADLGEAVASSEKGKVGRAGERQLVSPAFKSSVEV